LAALALTSCTTFEDDAQRTYTSTAAFGFPATFTTADARIITERVQPVTRQPVVCTEPSPDVAKAIATSFALSGQGGNGTASGGIAASGGSAEAVAELAGRTTALVGLRDGLYRACEAYANGVIGANAYALILGRYSQLMSTLFLGQDVAGVTAAAVTAQSPSVNATANAPGGSGSSASPSVAVTITPASTAAAPTAPAASPATGAAAALVRMNEDYLDLDYNTLHSLVLVCLNRADPTSLAGRAEAPGLDQLCSRVANLTDLNDLSKLTGLPSALVKNGVLASPVNPMAATPATGTGTKTPPKTPAKSKCVTMTPTQFGDVVTALQDKGTLQKKPFDSDNDPVTAIAAYQTKNYPKDAACPVGQIDQAELNELAPAKPKTPAN
jgi:hypothetical protein